MTFPYNTGVPATNNDPSIDQPDMLINTQSTNSILAVDHVTFNAQNGGQHKAIHFNLDANYTPVAFPVSPPALFTSQVGGLPQIKYYSGTQNQSANQYSMGANWSTFALGGIILKGGICSIAQLGSTTVTYSTLSPALTPFPNNTLSVLLTPISPATSQTYTYRVTAVSSTSFTVTISGVGAMQYYFLAVGW